MKVRFTLQLLCLMIGAYLTAAQITKGPRHTGVKLGGSATLECEATIPGGDTLVWNIHENDGVGYRIYQSGVGILPGPEGYDIIDGQNRYNLVINPASADKAESFSCRILHLNDIKEADLVVLESITCLSDATALEIGEELILPCSVNFDGEITPRLALKLDGATLHSTAVAVGNTISFQHNVSASIGFDDREFFCEVFFDATGGTEPEYIDQCSRHVYVNHPPRDLTISPDPDGYDDHVITRVLGENITCKAGGRPEPEIWFSKGNTADPDVEGGVMVIGTENIGRHTYTCNAQNNAGNRVNIERKDFTIAVSAEPPHNLEIYPDPDNYVDQVITRELGDHITCTAEGRPEPDIWFSKGNTTDHDVEGAVMVLGTEHIGRHTYQCHAQNRAGNIVNIESKEFTIDVSIDPRYVLKIYPDPANYVDQVITRELGDHITCTAEGHPEPDIWFSKGNTADRDVEGGVMVIGTEHIGRHTYQCHAFNRAGNIDNIESKEFTMDVRVDGSASGQSGLTSPGLSCVMAHVIVVVFSFLLHTYI